MSMEPLAHGHHKALPLRLGALHASTPDKNPLETKVVVAKH